MGDHHCGGDSRATAGIDLYWLPLGAGGHSVRWNGRVYEALAAVHERRPAMSLYHSALEMVHRGNRYVIEMGPVWNVATPNRGVVCEGPVAAKPLGRFRWFRYEVRCWRDGVIPDIAEAFDGPTRVTDDVATVLALRDALRRVPPLTWGRDELGTGEMWNSNSVVAWLLTTAGQDMTAIRPPAGGRAPGWGAGLALATRPAGAPGRARRERTQTGLRQSGFPAGRPPARRRRGEPGQPVPSSARHAASARSWHSTRSRPSSRGG